MAEPGETSAGVQALIDRLREQGVEPGRREAQRLVDDAQSQARQIVDDARAEAERLREEAREDIRRERQTAHDALRMAARDMVLAVKADMAGQFAAEVRRLVRLELEDRDFLKRLILEIAGKATEPVGKEEPVEVLLPTRVIGVDELRTDPEEASHGTLSRYVLGLSRDMLREGVELKPDPAGKAGIRLRLTEEDVVIDLTEETVATLLLRHLLPRFRALLEGIVR
ncbi:MAG: hypothetical protein GVY13_17125 [Alphaproteobacteria bacterium]|jgi:V/A-type H+-transporting ATPase subunit E|nr:hypothetical protein [Alphaproteobacteria bacterium]